MGANTEKEKKNKQEWEKIQTDYNLAAANPAMRARMETMRGAPKYGEKINEIIQEEKKSYGLNPNPGKISPERKNQFER